MSIPLLWSDPLFPIVFSHYSASFRTNLLMMRSRLPDINVGARRRRRDCCGAGRPLSSSGDHIVQWEPGRREPPTPLLIPQLVLIIKVSIQGVDAQSNIFGFVYATGTIPLVSSTFGQPQALAIYTHLKLHLTCSSLVDTLEDIPR